MIDPALTAAEVRLLGSLLEKEVTTPDNYPLSLSALTAACNQSSNRDPVMQLDEETVTQATVTLRRRSLLRAIQPSGSRVTKYMHLLGEALSLDARELAVLGVLMLRGEQTPGELHARTARLADFADLAQLETTIEALIAREPEPLVARLPRRPGQKEVRFAHLMSGPPVPADPSAPPRTGASVAGDPHEDLEAKVESLERAAEELRRDLTTLRAQFDEFRAQFG